MDKVAASIHTRRPTPFSFSKRKPKHTNRHITCKYMEAYLLLLPCPINRGKQFFFFFFFTAEPWKALALSATFVHSLIERPYFSKGAKLIHIPWNIPENKEPAPGTMTKNKTKIGKMTVVEFKPEVVILSFQKLALQI
eukprot:GHVL01028599.1.p1 GENE.GHVL01028599.1~~GHVL01028599.1.p1  ORF type:complete len:138 (+),score=10.21 GHVL01028599.1:679-1092(+)